MATGRIGTTPVLTTRWSKAPANGTTSLSGLDDNSVSLVYSVGYEQVYRNGVLLSRGNDYTATNGTSITLIDATITGDIIEVFANATVALTDTYTQTQANGKFINNTLTTTTGDIIYASAANTPARLGIGSTGQVLKVSGGVPAWGASGLTFISRTSFSNVATQNFDDVFTSTYESYMVIIETLAAATTSDDLHLLFRYGSSTETGSSYYGSSIKGVWNGTSVVNDNTNGTAFALLAIATGNVRGSLTFCGVGNRSETPAYFGTMFDPNQSNFYAVGGQPGPSRTYTGFQLKSSSTNITGTVAIYGIAKS